MRDLKTYKWIVLIFCYYIYPFVVNGASLFSYTITYGIPFIYVILNYNLSAGFIGKMKKSQFQCLVLVLTLTLASIVYPVLHHTDDFHYISAITFVFRKLLIYVFLCEVIIKKYKEKSIPEMFMYYFCVATSLYVVSTLIFLGFVPLRTFWMGCVSSENITELYTSGYGYVTRIGWQGFSGFRNTLRCSLSIVFLLYLYYEKHIINNIEFALLFAASFMGNMFYGRSGVAVSALCILAASLYYKIVKITMLAKWMLAAGAVFIMINWLRNMNIFLNQWYLWMTTPFKNLITMGSFNNISVERLLKNMIFIPEFKTLILGDGRYVFNNAYYMKTDSGFMRQILFWGLPGTILAYIATLLSMKRFSHTKMILLLIITFLLFEIKGEVYYEFIPLMLSLSFMKNWQEKMKVKRINDQ